MNLLDIIRQNRATADERNETNEQTPGREGLNSSHSFISCPQANARPEAERCLEWLTRFIRGRYPKLADVKAAAFGAGLSVDAIDAGLNSAGIVCYKTFPRRYTGEVEHVRTVDDWPDDPPFNNRKRFDEGREPCRSATKIGPKSSG